MKDNRPLPKTNGVVKEINVFEVAPLKLVTFRLTFLFRLWYAGCFRVCAKSAIRKIDLERNRSLKKVPAQGSDSISATKFQSLSQCGALLLMPSLVDFLLDRKCVWSCPSCSPNCKHRKNQQWNWDKLPLSCEE